MTTLSDHRKAPAPVALKTPPPVLLNNTSTAQARSLSRSARATLTAPPADAKTAPLAFHWSTIESTDFSEYIARLRSIGCPERLIRGLVEKEVGKVYAPRFAALRAGAGKTQYWESQWGGAYDRMPPAQRELFRALQKEQQQLLRSLLGEDFESLEHYGFLQLEERWTGRLKPDELSKVRAILEEFSEREEEIHRATSFGLDTEQAQELAQLKRRQRAALAAVLPPAELEEFELWTSVVAHELRHTLRGFNTTEAEFRALFRSQVAMADQAASLASDADPDAPPTPQAKAAADVARKASEQALAKGLGPERFAEYQLRSGHKYRNLFEWGLSFGDVQKVASLRESSERTVNELRSKPGVTAEQIQEASRAIRAATEAELGKLLDERHLKAYANGGAGYWIRNLSPHAPLPPGPP